MLAAAAVIGAAAYFGEFKTSNKLRGDLDAFASCLSDKGAKFYGTFWCPHCQSQKELFGSSQHLMPYVECSTPDGRQQTQVCKDAGIEAYPTWVFPDGAREMGELSLQNLAERTGCALPSPESE